MVGLKHTFCGERILLILDKDSSRLTESIQVLPEFGESNCLRIHPSCEPLVRDCVLVLLSGLSRLLMCDVATGGLFFGLFIEQSIVTIIMQISKAAHDMASLLLKHHPIPKPKVEEQS